MLATIQEMALGGLPDILGSQEQSYSLHGNYNINFLSQIYCKNGKVDTSRWHSQTKLSKLVYCMVTFLLKKLIISVMHLLQLPF